MNTFCMLSVAALVLCASCSRPPAQVDKPAPSQAQADPWRKVELDLAALDAAGLRGPADGKVAVSYEFCIPNTGACKAEVKRLDPTIQFMPGSRGRIGATKEQCLCIGSTHQRDYRKVLRTLAELPYVERIIECHFE